MIIKVNDWVAWKWGFGVAEGKVISIHHERTEIQSKGSRIVRNGTKDNPAVIILHKNQTEVLKLQSELIKAKED